jgi:hypothetical protein
LEYLPGINEQVMGAPRAVARRKNQPRQMQHDMQFLMALKNIGQVVVISRQNDRTQSSKPGFSSACSVSYL